MKKILILTFIVISFFSFAFAQSVKVLRQEAVKAINNNDFSTAKTYYEKILEKGHKTWETYVLLGDCEFKLGNIDAAWNYYQEGYKKAKVQDYATINVRMGTILMQQKKYEDAWMEFLKVEITRPNDPAAKKLQATALYHMEKYDDALFTLNQAEKYDDSDLEIKYYKGLILFKQNKVEDACKNFKMAKGLDIPDLKILTAQHCNKP
ncbi:MULTISPECIES: tetratricopeptide repeat protein [Chryseobacterium]|uniref:tetratricopeptide repeat protein n=1 Tax=Chryseobacterium TaxID=59732 RepID=UPI00195E5536|nr:MULTISPECIES: tetratricopeptide repeat protein [Chryseobacterium]MBM7418540.1 tetratricopeptide (TPR) repeat protein [Chryseobacterium sp. JUb44]MDH6208449.1 tetratricopeptide (TPR) repeat protein [Chryseobacterium sp. BIGb0186]WSO11341.1 tetratricopeptide repeat protein [Chryseobacterium scophthalmum]